MQIEIMASHRTNDPQRHCQPPMVQDFALGNKALQDSRQIWLSNNDFVTKTSIMTKISVMTIASIFGNPISLKEQKQYIENR